MNLPTPSSSAAANPPPAPRPPAADRRIRLAVIAAAVTLAAISLIFGMLPAEIARWQVAAALVAHDRGNVAQVEAWLDRAASYAPSDPTVLLTRCRIMRDLERFDESLAAADRLLELTPQSVLARRERGATLMQMRRFAEAAETFESILGNSPDSFSLNNLAYARALAGENLEAGLKEIDRALELRGEQDIFGRAALIDTRGYLLYRQGKYQQALSEFDRAIDALDLRRIGHLENRLGKQRPEIRQEFEALRESVAVMLYHRALTHEALGQNSEAEADFAKVRELGYEPGEDLF